MNQKQAIAILNRCLRGRQYIFVYNEAWGKVRQLSKTECKYHMHYPEDGPPKYRAGLARKSCFMSPDQLAVESMVRFDYGRLTYRVFSDARCTHSLYPTPKAKTTKAPCPETPKS